MTSRTPDVEGAGYRIWRIAEGLRVVFEDPAVVPFRVEFTAIEAGGARVVRLTQLPGGPLVTSRELGRLPLNSLAAGAFGLYGDMVDEDDVAIDRVSQRTDDPEALLIAVVKAYKAVVRSGSRHPTRDTHRQITGYSYSHIAHQISKARERGLLPPVRGGRP